MESGKVCSEKAEKKKINAKELKRHPTKHQEDSGEWSKRSASASRFSSRVGLWSPVLGIFCLGSGFFEHQL